MVASLGKTVIHPGGRPTTDFMFQAGRFEPDHEVLEVGCGVGTTAIRLATEKDCRVCAIDIDPALVDRARRAVRRAGRSQQVSVQQGDALNLPFDDARFDRVLVEAVLMFVDRSKALDEIARVSRAGAMVLDHEVATPDTTPDGDPQHRLGGHGSRGAGQCRGMGGPLPLGGFRDPGDPGEADGDDLAQVPHSGRGRGRCLKDDRSRSDQPVEAAPHGSLHAGREKGRTASAGHGRRRPQA